MIALLPAELKPLFEKRRAFIVERAIDPDLWRNVGWEEEPPNHFLDMDYEAFGPYPFDGLPRDYDRRCRSSARTSIHEQGLLPWRTAEFYGRLQREFESLKRQAAPGYALDNIVLYSAILAHYVSDGHVPLHAVVNYNGQLTNQNRAALAVGSELFERNRGEAEDCAGADQAGDQSARLHVRRRCWRATAPRPTCSSRTRRRPPAASSTTMPTSRRSRQGTLPVLEQRLNESIAAVASMIIGAWEQAGRPAVPTELPRTPRRIRRPNPVMDVYLVPVGPRSFRVLLRGGGGRRDGRAG